MVSVYDVDSALLVNKLANELKGELKEPAWAKFVKTSAAKEKPPEQKDWYYTRTASIMIKLYKKGPIGVSRLRTEYKDKKRRGTRPEKSYKAGGKIVRGALQELERLGYVKNNKDKKGRELTPKGQSKLAALAK